MLEMQKSKPKIQTDLSTIKDPNPRAQTNDVKVRTPSYKIQTKCLQPQMPTRVPKPWIPNQRPEINIINRESKIKPPATNDAETNIPNQDPKLKVIIRSYGHTGILLHYEWEIVSFRIGENIWLCRHEQSLQLCT